MPSTRIRKFTNIDEAQAFLNGGIIGAAPVGGVSLFDGLVGQTLTFSSPAGAVTFVNGPGGSQLRFADVQSQIVTALPGLRVAAIDGRIVIVETDPSAGVALSANDEVTKRILGFSYKDAVIGQFYSPHGIGDGPYILHIAIANETTHVIYTWE